MSAQTAYTKNIRKAVKGQAAWDFGTADITTVIAEAVIPFGHAVIKGAADGSGIVGDTLVLGFAVRSLINENSVENRVNSFAQGEATAIMREGYIYIQNDSPATAIAEGEDVFVDPTGAVVASGDAGAVKVTGCRVEESAAAGSIARIRVQINRA